MVGSREALDSLTGNGVGPVQPTKRDSENPEGNGGLGPWPHRPLDRAGWIKIWIKTSPSPPDDLIKTWIKTSPSPPDVLIT